MAQIHRSAYIQSSVKKFLENNDVFVDKYFPFLISWFDNHMVVPEPGCCVWSKQMDMWFVDIMGSWFGLTDYALIMNTS